MLKSIQKITLLIVFLTITYNCYNQELVYKNANAYTIVDYEVSTPIFEDFSHIIALPEAITFSNDGLKIFIVANSSNNIYEIHLTEAFDITSANNIPSSAHNIFSDDINATGITFNADGTKLFFTGTSNSSIYQYDLSTAFDISSIASSTADESYDVSAVDEFPQGITFNDDGTKMYTVGNGTTSPSSGDLVNEFSLSTAYDLSSTITHEHTYNINSFETDVKDLAFNRDGTTLYILGNTGNDITEVALSSAFDLAGSTLTVNSTTRSVSNETTTPRGIYIKKDGSELYVLDSDLDGVFQYNIPVAHYLESIDNDGTINNDTPLTITLEGGDTFDDLGTGTLTSSQVSITNIPDGLTAVFTLSGVNTIATLTFTGTATNHEIDNDDVSNIIFDFDDSAFTTSTAADITNAENYTSIVGINFLKNIKELNYYGPNSYNIASASLTQTYDLSSEGDSPQGMTFNEDGTKMYISQTGTSNDYIYEYNLSVAFDISTSTLNKRFYVGSYETNTYGVVLSKEGTKLYIVGSGDQQIDQFGLYTPFDLGSIYYEQTVASGDTVPEDLLFNNDGSKLYVVGNNANKILEYDLSTNYDVSTKGLTVDAELILTTHDVIPTGMAFNYDGSKLFITGATHDKILEYDLSTNYDVSTGTISQKFYHENTEGGPQNLVFNKNGTKMFLLGRLTNDFVYEYEIAPGNYPEDTSTNDGTVDNTKPLIIKLTGDTFSDLGTGLLTTSQVTVSNVPSGLTPVLTITDTTTLTITFTGKATNHEDSNDTNNITFTFNNSAFTGGDATAIDNSSSYNTNVGFNFQNRYEELIYLAPNAHDISTTPTYNSVNKSIGEDNTVLGMTFNNDGTKMYVIGSQYDNINEYDLSTAYNPSTATLTTSFNASLYDTNRLNEELTPTDFAFNNTGTSIFVLGDDKNQIVEYTLTEPYSVLTSSIANTLDISSYETSPQGITFNTDGTKVYIVGLGSGGSTGTVTEINLGAAFDITATLGTTTAFNVNLEETAPKGIGFNSIGTKMYVIGDNATLYQYDLSAAFNFVTSPPSYSGNSFNITQDTAPKDIAFNKDGSKLYVLGGTNNTVYEYDIGLLDYTEDSSTNDGSIDNTYTMLIQIKGDTFVDSGSDSFNTSNVTTNIPSGLSAQMDLLASDTVIELTLTGNADDHFDSNDLANLTFDFNAASFTNSSTASDVNNAVTYTSATGIDFIGCTADITYDGTWTGGSGTGGIPDSSSDSGKGIIIKNSVTIDSSIGFIICDCIDIESGAALTIDDGLRLEVANELILNGELRLVGSAQFLQTHTGTSNVDGTGSLYVDQTSKTTDLYGISYWSSPVKTIGKTTYTIGDVLKDGSTATSATSTPNDFQYISSVWGNPSTTPITVSKEWIFSYLDGSDVTSWVKERETGTFNPGQGFSLKGPQGSQTYTFVGTPNDGDYSYTISADNYSLLGNPYPSALDANQLFTDNSTTLASLYFWEHKADDSDHDTDAYEGGYGVRNAGTGTAAMSAVTSAGLGSHTYTEPKQFIPIGQGFFAEASPTGGTITFNNSQRDTIILSSESVFFRSDSEIAVLKMGFEFKNVDGIDLHRQTAVTFKKGNSFAYDNGYESKVRDLNDSDFYYKFPGDDNKYIITGVQEASDTLEIPVTIKIGAYEDVKIMVDTTENLSHKDILLLDKSKDTIYNLKETLELNLASGEYNNRFFIGFKEKSSLDIDEFNLKQIIHSFYNSIDKQLVIKNQQRITIKKINIYNILGKKIKEFNLNSKKTIQKLPLSNLRSKMFLIQIQTEKGIYSKKIIAQ